MSKSIHERWKEDAKDYEKRAVGDKDMKERVEKKKAQLKESLKHNKDNIRQLEELFSKKI